LVSPLPLRPLHFAGPSTCVQARKSTVRVGLGCLSALGVFTLPDAQGVITLPKRSSLDLSPLSRALQPCRRCRRLPELAAAFLAVSSPSTSSRTWAATYFPAVTSLRVPVPPQRFARSRGFDPPLSCRPCFMPVPSLGFHPSGSIPTRRAVPSLEGHYPLVVGAFVLASASFDPRLAPR
jgi:hypothetical protein